MPLVKASESSLWTKHVKWNDSFLPSTQNVMAHSSFSIKTAFKSTVWGGIVRLVYFYTSHFHAFKLLWGYLSICVNELPIWLQINLVPLKQLLNVSLFSGYELSSHTLVLNWSLTNWHHIYSFLSVSQRDHYKFEFTKILFGKFELSSQVWSLVCLKLYSQKAKLHCQLHFGETYFLPPPVFDVSQIYLMNFHRNPSRKAPWWWLGQTNTGHPLFLSCVNPEVNVDLNLITLTNII